MKRIKQFTSRMLAVMLAGTLVVGSVSVNAFGSEDVGSTVAAAEEFSFDEVTEENIAETSSAEVADGETLSEPSSAEAVGGEVMSEPSSAEEAVEEGVTELPDSTFVDTTQIAAEEEAATSYTVTLDANGGYFANEWDDSIGDYVEQTDVVVKQIPVGGTVAAFPVYINPDGQTMLFAGWSLERDGELVTMGDEEYAPVDNCVLYAVWETEEIATEPEDASWRDTGEAADESSGRDAEVAEAGFGDTGAEEAEHGDTETTEETDTAQEYEDTEIVYETEDEEDTGTTDESDSAQETVEDVNVEEDTAPDEQSALETFVPSKEDSENRSNSAGTGEEAQIHDQQDVELSADSTADAGGQEIITSEEEEETIVSDRLFASVNTPSDGNRYTVLLMDNSASCMIQSR